MALEKGTLKLLSRVATAHTDLVNAIAANPFSANSIVTAGNDGKVLTWDLRKTNIDGNISQSCKPMFILSRLYTVSEDQYHIPSK